MKTREHMWKFSLSIMSACLAVGVTAQEGDDAEEALPDPLEQAGMEVVETTSLEDLLEKVRERRLTENREHAEREREFVNQRNQRQRLLDEANAEERRQNQLSDRLNTQFESNQIEIANKQELLDKRLGALRELFGVISQVSGDTRAVLNGSIVSFEYPGRGDFLGELAQKMGTATELATIEEMEELWIILQQEMIETGKVSKFRADVNLKSGEVISEDVIRVGAFNLVTDEGYVNLDLGVGQIVELARQPPAEFERTAHQLYEADAKSVVPFAIDPTRGQLLSLEVQRATLGERVGTVFGGFSLCWLPFCDGQGGIVGSIIILVGIAGVIMAIERLITLSLTKIKVDRQKSNPDEPNEKNPLGRVIGVYQANKNVDVETLQLKMGEAVLQETPSITRNITIIQVISVVAPLMGLLGTVIGMIQTFQAITLFGTGDPKIMASGISTALMTTVLGLCVAIPTVLLHALVNQRSRGVIHILDEQSEGIIAQHAETSGEKLG